MSKVFVRQGRQEMSEVKHSLKWVFIWMMIACAFEAGIYFLEGSDKCLEFFAGYLIEFSLSMDNLFVFMSIFMAYDIVEHAQHRVLTRREQEIPLLYRWRDELR